VLQIAVIGGAGPAFFGLKNLAHLPALPDLATRSQGGAYGAWNVFQRENHARWISLTVNRLLLRGPHGEGEAPAADRFRYAETVDPAHPEWLCWGNACWAAGVSLALSYAEHGHCAAADGLSGTGGHHHLPVRLVPGGMGKTASVTTEVVLPDQKAWDLCRAGFTPLVGMANGDSAYFPFLGNVYRSRPGSVTVDQSLLYQLYAGQLGHVVLKLAPRLRGLGPEEAVRQLEQGIFAHLSPFVGDAPGQKVKVTAAAAPDGTAVASIQVSPTFKIQDKPVELELQLPLG
jgi:predicted component of type VI protein secretion system